MQRRTIFLVPGKKFSLYITTRKMSSYTISFPGSKFDDLCLSDEDTLSAHLTVQNSPVLFGCRTGLCGTCLVRVTGDVLPPQAAEQEVLQILAPADSQVRLACQIHLTGHITLEKYGV